MPEHPAKEFLLTTLSFNLPQLKDLDYILELASLYLKDTGGQWPERIAKYREIFNKRIEEMEQELK